MHVSAPGNRCDPVPEKIIEEGLSKKSQQPAEESAIASSRKEAEPSVKNTAVGFRADNISLLERKIQQLKKQRRPFDVYTTGPDNQLSLSDNSSMIDAAVISYDSKGPVQQLNCKAFNRRDDSIIACKHLAYTFAIGGFGFKTKVTKSESREPGSKFNAVSSIRKLQKNAAIQTGRQLKNTPVSWGIPKVAVYFDADHFGQALYDVWMNKGDQIFHGKSSQTWLLSTENHVIAIRLMPAAGSAIRIEWYDPNFTTIVRRVIVSNKETLQQLTLNQFVSMNIQKSYAIDQRRSYILKSTEAVKAENDSDLTIFTALTPSLLYLLMRHGQLNSGMNSLKMTLSEVRFDNPRELIELLAAKSVDEASGLFMALQHGHQATISTYIKVIKQRRDTIEPEDISKLLACKRRSDGTPGVYMARLNGRRKAIRTYVEGVKQFGGIIEPKVIKELLAGKIGKPESTSSRARNQSEKSSDQDFLCKIL